MDSIRCISMPSWLLALLACSSLAIIPAYRDCAAISAVAEDATLPPSTLISVMVSVVHFTPLRKVHRKVTMATRARLTLMSMSLNLTVMFTSGKIISKSAMGMSWKDLRMSGPAPPGPAFCPSCCGCAMRYMSTTSLNVGSCSSMVVKRFLSTATGVGMSRRSVRRSTIVVSVRSFTVMPPSFLDFLDTPAPTASSGANTTLGLPTSARMGSIMHISISISIFSEMNLPLAVATPLPRLKSSAASANCVRPWLSAGFCFRKVPMRDLSNLFHAISHGSVNRKFSALASSHSFCVSSEKLASAMSEQKSPTKSTDKSWNSAGLSCCSDIFIRLTLSSCAAVTRSKLRFMRSRDSRYS
mmetsp:Transcript_23835/g.58457  ORF Transcript_23835/g.58457 Transcript_23835/m.58457 type:complete len:356 (+) Transcript_23835:910-1977(+)